MKKINLLLMFLFLISFTSIKSQELGKTPSTKYRRSSLETIIIESETFPKKDTVINAFLNAPFPEKYDEQSIGIKSMDPKPYALTIDEKKGLKKSTSVVGDLLGSMGSKELTSLALTKGIVLDPATFTIDRTLLPEEVPVIIGKYLKSNNIANKMVAKWFDRQDDGSFDMKLIGERGQYNATEMEANIAKKTAQGNALLTDAGEELIGNTFLVVNRFNFVKNEISANLVRLVARIAASKLPSPFNLAANKTADLIYKATSVGYSVTATSYLYKLNWNDSVQAVFYKDLYIDKSNPDLTKKLAFDNGDLFKLEFVGSENAKGLVMIDLTSKVKRSEETLIKTVTIRTIDAVYAKLQKKYDVFMPKTALYSGGNMITAKIGMKEGLVGGEKFEVFEQTQDPVTGLTKYVSKGKITVDKNQIWDNRYDAGDVTIASADEITPDNSAKTPLTCTTFKGGKNFFAGMLIKQIK